MSLIRGAPLKIKLFFNFTLFTNKICLNLKGIDFNKLVKQIFVLRFCVREQKVSFKKQNDIENIS